MSWLSHVVPLPIDFNDHLAISNAWITYATKGRRRKYFSGMRREPRQGAPAVSHNGLWWIHLYIYMANAFFSSNDSFRDIQPSSRVLNIRKLNFLTERNIPFPSSDPIVDIKIKTRETFQRTIDFLSNINMRVNDSWNIILKCALKYVDKCVLRQLIIINLKC